MAKNTCCVVGYQDIPTGKQENVDRELEHEINLALEDGFRIFLTVFGRGIGKRFVRLIYKQRADYPDIFLEIILHNDYPKELRDSDWKLISKSNCIKFPGKGCREDHMLNHVRYMVGLSERVIVVYDEQDVGGTLYSINYAYTMQRELRVIEI